MDDGRWTMDDRRQKAEGRSSNNLKHHVSRFTHYRLSSIVYRPSSVVKSIDTSWRLAYTPRSYHHVLRNGPDTRMLNVTSEIGTLRRVVVHAPGQEVRRMTPALRHDLLFDDILYLDLARHEHEAFRRLLSVIVPPEDVLDSADLLREVVEDEVTRHSLVESVCRLGVGPNTDPQALCREMMDAEPDQLVSWLIEGKPHPGRHEELTSYLSEMPYQLPPIPNLMFMRDPCAIVGAGMVVGNMAYPARQREALLMRYVYQSHPLAGGGDEPPLWFDMLSPYALVGGDPARKEATIEGGDVLVIRSDLVLVGVSERTSPQAVDALARGLAQSGAPVKTVYAVIMPKQRSTMHLDTIFTMMSHEDLMVYPPLIMPGGGEQVGIVRITINSDGSNSFAADEEVVGKLPGGGAWEAPQSRLLWRQQQAIPGARAVDRRGEHLRAAPRPYPRLRAQPPDLQGAGSSGLSHHTGGRHSALAGRSREQPRVGDE